MLPLEPEKRKKLRATV